MKSENIQYLDGWRGLAIILVLLGHFTELHFLGRFGVDVFFVLSGLLISNLLFVKKTPLKEFYFKRFSRVYPAFLFYVSVVYLFGLFFSSVEISNFFYTIFFLRSYFPADSHIMNTDLPIGHLWSLNVEEHSYIILSIFTLSFLSNTRKIFFIFCIGLISIFSYYLHIKGIAFTSESFQIQTHTSLSFIFISSTIFLIRQIYSIKLHPSIPLLCFILSMISYSSFTPHWILSWAITPFLLSISVNFLQDSYKAIRIFLNNPILLKFGLLSFSIYLWQQPMFQILNNQESFSYLTALFLCLISLFIAYISYYYIENPMRKYLNSRFILKSISLQ